MTSTSLRRSTTSAIEPPSKPTASTGTNVSPSRPTASEECDRSQICSTTAKLVIAPPRAESRPPVSSRRNAGCSRAGPKSGSRRVSRALPAGPDHRARHPDIARVWLAIASRAARRSAPGLASSGARAGSESSVRAASATRVRMGRDITALLYLGGESAFRRMRRERIRAGLSEAVRGLPRPSLTWGRAGKFLASWPSAGWEGGQPADGLGVTANPIRRTGRSPVLREPAAARAARSWGPG